MTHEAGASDPLAAIQGQLDGVNIRFDRMETRFDVMYETLRWHGAMLKLHGDHFNNLEATLTKHGDMLKAHGDMLKAHGDMLKAHDRRFDQIDAKLAEHGNTLRSHDRRFDQVDARFDQVDEALQKILARLDAPRP